MQLSNGGCIGGGGGGGGGGCFATFSSSAEVNLDEKLIEVVRSGMFILCLANAVQFHQIEVKHMNHVKRMFRFEMMIATMLKGMCG